MSAVVLAASGWMLQPMLHRAVSAHSDVALYWSALTGIIGGASVWSVHFVAMPGYRPQVPIFFLQGPTILSLFIAIASMTGVALTSRLPFFKRHPAASGLAFAASVAWMHYAGMAGLVMGLTHH